MSLLSLFGSGDRDRSWSLARAAMTGAAIGAAAALLRTFGPIHGTGPIAARLAEIAVAAAGFAALFAATAALRNALQRRLRR